MNEPENFAARWSRLKRDTVKEKAETDTARSDPRPVVGADTNALEGPGPESAPIAADGRAEAAFDVASLPSIESITASSDIRVFLQSGVPAELTKAALRRVWTTDPAIRDFIGIAENQWDFTDPTAMPGFGPLEATDDVRELVAQAMGKLGQVSEPSAEAAVSPRQGVASTSSVTHTPLLEREPQVTGMPVENEVRPEGEKAEHSVEVQDSIVNAASQHDDFPAQEGLAGNRRTHGGALPQ